MLEYIRSNAQSFGVKLAFGLIILVFVFWGVGSFTDRDAGNTVAAVNGEAISIQQFEHAYQNAEEATLRERPDITRDELKNRGLGLQVLQELTFEILLRQLAGKSGILISPLELRQAVGQIKTFQDQQGRFDPEAYKRVLAAQRTSPAQYEQSVSTALLRDKLYAMITSSAWIAPDEAKNQYDFMRQTRKIEYIFFPASKMIAASAPTDEEMLAYYAIHKNDFVLPPKVALEYIIVTPETAPGGDNKAAQGNANDRLHEVLDSLMEDNILNKNLAESAARFGLNAQKTGLLSQAEIENTLTLTPDKASILLAGNAETPIDAVIEAKEQFLIARVLEAAPQTVSPFDDVKDGIRTRIIAEKSLVEAKERAVAQLAKLDETPLTETQKKEMQVKNASLKRMGALDEFEQDSSLDEAIFAAAPNQWLSNAFTVNSKAEGTGAFLCRTTAVEVPDLQEWQSLQGLMENITVRERVESLFQIFMLNLFAQAKVEVLKPNIIERKGF